MDGETNAPQTVVGSIESAAPRAKRPRKEADKRRARVQDVHNKYADIDFSRYQDTHADQYPPTLSMAEDASAAQGNSGAASGRIVPVKPVPTATVQHWRLWESYERNGDKSFSETEFALLCEQEGHRRHYKGPPPPAAWGEAALCAGDELGQRELGVVAADGAGVAPSALPGCTARRRRADSPPPRRRRAAGEAGSRPPSARA